MMRPDMVYQFPIGAVGLSLTILAVIGTILLELGVRHFVSAAFRRQHNDIAAAIFSIIGVTVIEAANGLAEPAKANLLDGMKRYTRAVIGIEWPAQAEGHVARPGDRSLDDVQRLVIALKPASQADTNLHALLLESLTQHARKLVPNPHSAMSVEITS